MKRLTNEGDDDEEDVEAGAGASGGKEIVNGMHVNGSKGYGEQHLEGEDVVDLPDETHLSSGLSIIIGYNGPRAREGERETQRGRKDREEEEKGRNLPFTTKNGGP